MIRYGMTVLKGVLKQHNIVEFILYDWMGREGLLRDMLSVLPRDKRDMFTTRGYTDERGYTYPCICLSPYSSSEYYCALYTCTCTVVHTTIHFGGVCSLQYCPCMALLAGMHYGMVCIDLFESLVHTMHRYPGKCSQDIIRIHTHTYSIIAKSSVNIDCELEVLYSNTAYVYVYNTMISYGTRYGQPSQKCLYLCTILV